jgi:hypothetical protein
MDSVFMEQFIKRRIDFLFITLNFLSLSLFTQSLTYYQAAADDATRRLEEALIRGSTVWYMGV